jgi:thiol-disulfide isomerase/thioredoxin
MLSRPKLAFLFGFAGLAALAGGYLASELLRAPAVAPALAPGFIEVTGADLQGKPRRLSEWQGKILVVNFWATWCPPCREEIPLFIASQERYGPQGVQVIGVAIDQPAEVEAYYREAKMNYPTLIADGNVYQAMQNLGNTTSGLPFSVVYDREGHVRSRKLGAFHGSELDRVLAPLLGSKS